MAKWGVSLDSGPKKKPAGSYVSCRFVATSIFVAVQSSLPTVLVACIAFGLEGQHISGWRASFWVYLVRTLRNDGGVVVANLPKAKHVTITGLGKG